MSGERESLGQLALGLFRDDPSGSVINAKKEIGYGKPQSLLQISNLSLLTRRVLNACYFLASDTNNKDETIRSSLSYFRWLTAYDSTNIPYLKKALREAQSAAITVSVIDRDSVRDTWVSIPLLGVAGIADGQVAFKLDKYIRDELQQEGGLSFLSLRITAAFTSKYAVELYEKLQPYRDVGVSPWISVDELRGSWFGVKSMEYKVMKRDVITPSIQQINEISDIYIDDLEVKRGEGTKRITEVRFVFRHNENGRMVLGAPAQSELKQIYQTLAEDFGLSDAQIAQVADAMAEGKTIDQVKSAIEYTRSRILSGKRVAIPAKYFLDAFQNGYRTPKLTAQSLAVGSKGREIDSPAVSSVPEESRPTKEAEAVTVFLSDSGTDEQREVLWQSFMGSPSAKLLAKKFAAELASPYWQALSNPRIAGPFGGWLIGTMNSVPVCNRPEPSPAVEPKKAVRTKRARKAQADLLSA